MRIVEALIRAVQAKTYPPFSGPMKLTAAQAWRLLSESPVDGTPTKEEWEAMVAAGLPGSQVPGLPIELVATDEESTAWANGWRPDDAPKPAPPTRSRYLTYSPARPMKEPAGPAPDAAGVLPCSLSQAGRDPFPNRGGYIPARPDRRDAVAWMGRYRVLTFDPADPMRALTAALADPATDWRVPRALVEACGPTLLASLAQYNAANHEETR
jgi:hypothetical protein